MNRPRFPKTMLHTSVLLSLPAFISLALCFSGLPAARAQVADGSSTATSSLITLTASPSAPSTDELLTVTAALNGGNEGSNTFTWYIQGQKRADLSGLGQSFVVFAAPSTPGVLKIRVEVEGPISPTPIAAELSLPLQLSASTGVMNQLQQQANELSAKGTAAAETVNITLQQTPRAPKPGDLVTFTVNSFQESLDAADIAWFFNGKKIGGGKGVKIVSVPLGAAGSTNVIRVSVTLPDGRRAEASRSVIPAAIQFYWWTNTYVPPWYRAKALAAPGAAIFIQARPTFSSQIANALVYTWFFNDEIMSQASGQGKSVFIYTLPAANSPADTIRVRVANLSSTISQEASFSAPTISPELLVYEVRPLEGTDISKTVTSLARQAGRTIDVVAEPFFTPRQALANLSYQWKLNGKDVLPEQGQKPSLFTLTSKPDTTGIQTISVFLQNPKDNSQTSSQSLQINLQ